MNIWKDLITDHSVETKSQFETELNRLIASQDGSLFSNVTPDNCMDSPTVQAIVTAISRRIAVTPIHVFRRDVEGGREVKEKLPDHPVARLLQRPNSWQSRYEFWQDAASVLVRHGRFHAYKSRGSTGPVRELIPLDTHAVTPQLDSQYRPSYRVIDGSGEKREYAPSQLFNARGPARDYITGDSPVKDIARTIAMEILAEKFGAAFFKNGAIPLLILSFLEGSAGFKDPEQEKSFIRDFQSAFSGDKVHRGMLLPKGMAPPTPINVEHDKAQFIETRKYQRSVIAGAFGVPPHLVGDLERGTFNNVEQQDKDFTLNVIMPIAQAFEAAMERDLLTDNDRRSGIAVRFNLDAILRADFKSRQEGLWLQRQAGVINANEWREIEGKNPRTDEDGDDYLHPGNMIVDGEEMNEDATDDETRDQIPE